MREQLKDALVNYLALVTKENFSKKYDGLAEIAIGYHKETGLAKESIYEVLMEIHKRELDYYQEEVLLDLSDRLKEYCPPHRRINW